MSSCQFSAVTFTFFGWVTLKMLKRLVFSSDNCFISVLMFESASSVLRMFAL